MDKEDIKNFASVLAIQAEIEGMKVYNKQRELQDESPGYNQSHFNDMAEQLNVIYELVETTKEDNTPEEPIYDIIGYKGLTWEDNEVSFELTILTEDDDFDKVGVTSTPVVEVTYKKGTKEDWTTDYWDNVIYLLATCQGDVNDAELRSTLSVFAVAALKAMLKEANGLGWFKNIDKK